MSHRTYSWRQFCNWLWEKTLSGLRLVRFPRNLVFVREAPAEFNSLLETAMRVRGQDRHDLVVVTVSMFFTCINCDDLSAFPVKELRLVKTSYQCVAVF